MQTIMNSTEKWMFQVVCISVVGLFFLKSHISQSPRKFGSVKKHTQEPFRSERGGNLFPEVACNFLPEVLAKILMYVFAVASYAACPGACQFTDVKHRPLMCWVEERNQNIEHWVTAAEFYVESMTQKIK